MRYVPLAPLVVSCCLAIAGFIVGNDVVACFGIASSIGSTMLLVKWSDWEEIELLKSYRAVNVTRSELISEMSEIQNSILDANKRNAELTKRVMYLESMQNKNDPFGG